MIDDRIAEAWSTHPRRFEVAATPDFFAKVTRAIAIVADLLPACCRQRTFQARSDHGSPLGAPP
jgi:hypothetical protein